MSIDVNDEPGFASGINLEEASDLAKFVLDRMRVYPAVGLSVFFEDRESVARFHVEWIGLDGPTDVLSLPVDELRPMPIGEEPHEGVLGDVIVYPQVAAGQAYTARHMVVEGVLPLVTHGILHLLGYDRVKEGGQREMFDLQRQLLLTFLADRRTNPVAPEPTEIWAIPACLSQCSPHSHSCAMASAPSFPPA